MTRVVKHKENKKNFTSPMLIQVKRTLSFSKGLITPVLSNKHKALV